MQTAFALASKVIVVQVVVEMTLQFFYEHY
jgi:hypothetical protein